jgi:acyl carrier protein
MIKREEILGIIHISIEELNEQLGDAKRLNLSPGAPLYGAGGGIDSISLVNLIVSIEQLVEERFNKTIILADDRAMSQFNSPFKSIESLLLYVEKLVNEKKHD